MLPRPTLPGLIRYLASAAAQSGCSRNSLWPLKWKSPMSGTVDARALEALADGRDRRCRLRGVHRNTHQLRSGARERLHLAGRGLDIRGVRIGHGLDHDRCIAAEAHRADGYLDCGTTIHGGNVTWDSIDFSVTALGRHRKAAIMAPARIGLSGECPARAGTPKAQFRPETLRHKNGRRRHQVLRGFWREVDSRVHPPKGSGAARA